MMCSVPLAISEQMRYLQDHHNLFPNGIQAWAALVGYSMSVKSVRYHLLGKKHPMLKASKAKNKELYIIEDLLESRHGIRVRRNIARRAHNSIQHTWGSSRTTPLTWDVNKEKRILYAKAWMEVNQCLDETLVSLERVNRMCYRPKGRFISKPTQPATLHVWRSIPTDSTGLLVILLASSTVFSSKNKLWTKALCHF